MTGNLTTQQTQFAQGQSQWSRILQRAVGALIATAALAGLVLVFMAHSGRPEQSAAGTAAVVACAGVHALGVATIMRTFHGWTWPRAAAIGIGCAGIAIVACYVLPLIAAALGGLSFGWGDDDDDNSSPGGGGGEATAGTTKGDGAQRTRPESGLCPACGRASGGGVCPLCRP